MSKNKARSQHSAVSLQFPFELVAESRSLLADSSLLL